MNASDTLKPMIGCNVKVKLRKRNYTLTGVLSRIVLGKIVLMNERTGNDYRIRVNTIRYVQNTETGITVHNFLQDGEGAALMPQKRK